jgi:hypothetical protein
LTPEAFRSDYEKPNLPVVLTKGQEFAPACSKWYLEYLREELRGRRVMAGVSHYMVPLLL